MKIENLSVSLINGIEREILKDIDLEINSGEWMGLVGETGSGKTTLLRSIIRLLPEGMFFKKGKILFDGKDLLKINEEEMRKIRGSEIFMIIQEPHSYFNPSIKIYRQIKEFAISHRKEGERDLDDVIYNCLEFAGLEEPEKWVKMFPFQLSSGMLQRIGIGMALLYEPKFILADEPTSSLDRVHEKQIINLFLNLKATKKIGFIFVTHRIELLKDLAEKIAVIYKGCLLEVGETKKVFLDPLHPYTSLLLRGSAFGKPLFRPIDNQYSCSFSNLCPSRFKKCEENPPYFKREDRVVRCWKYE